MRRIAITGALFVAVLHALSSPAEAQRRRPPPVEQGPTAEARAQAREAYARGQELFRSGDFAGAEAAFQQAYEAVPNPVVLVSIGESRERAGNLTGAVESFERYLAERTDAPDAARVRARIDELRARPATLVISSTPAGAAIAIDGAPRDERTPARIQVPPGSHTIDLSFDAHERASETVEATFGATHEVDVVLEPAPAIADPFEGEPEPAPTPTRADEGGVSTGVWVASGFAAAGVIAGTVLGFFALSEQAKFDDTPTEETADRGQTFALFADVSFAVAGVAAITAIVLYFTQRSSGSSSDDRAEGDAQARWTVAPVVGPHGGGVGAHVAF